eukprot:7490038-Lingulodinium_polyedra.AAC.1
MTTTSDIAPSSCQSSLSPSTSSSSSPAAIQAQAQRRMPWRLWWTPLRSFLGTSGVGFSRASTPSSSTASQRRCQRPSSSLQHMELAQRPCTASGTCCTACRRMC